MKRLIPQTLFGQTLLLLLSGIGLSLLAGSWIYTSARQEAVRAVGGLAAAERIINLTRLIEDVPFEWRERIIASANDAVFRVRLTGGEPMRPGADAATPEASLVKAYLSEGLPSHTVRVALAVDAGGVHVGPWQHHAPWPGMGRGAGGPMAGPRADHIPMMHGPLARWNMSWRGLEAHVQLKGGQWLSFSTTLPDTGPTMSPRLIIALVVMAFMIALLTAWAARRLAAPLTLLADAAEQLGRDIGAPPLAVSGSKEVRSAAQAFNDMQERLRRLVENRTQMLSAISHDLRTQLTLLRLRVEAGDQTDDRERMLSTIGEMEDMLTATLSFARDEATSETGKRVDIGTFVGSIAADMADAGLPVETGEIRTGVVAHCKPLALRRALTNLIDNAIKYGTTATISMRAGAERVEIMVDDQGPGIPEDQLERVMQPFVRLEESRSRDTGGIGLGLAIAASIAEAHGGKLMLSNRREGGLTAILALPR
jgi:signal transduction histidine kinase